MNTEAGIGLELIETETAKILFNDLNTEIDAQQAKWNTRDEEWNVLTGLEPSNVIVEPIEDVNFNKGHRPSLIQAPIENYPNVSVMAYQGRATNSQIDQATNFTIILDIELMVKGANEGECNARIHRVTEAVHQVLVRNYGLNGLSYGWDDDPVVNITDVFIRREQTSYGEVWYWQAVRLRYTLTRNSEFPTDI